MTQILPGYNAAVKQIDLPPISKEINLTLSYPENLAVQQLPEPAKEKSIDENRNKNGLLPTLQNRAGLLQALVELKQSNIPVSAESYAEVIENINYSMMQQENYAGNNEFKSDIEIQQQIQGIINGTQKDFMDPFMTASQKMTDYYNSISAIRDLLSNNIKPDPKDKDNKGTLIIHSNIYRGIRELIEKWSLSALYPTSGSGVSEAEAEDWCKKMGVGKVIGSGSEQCKVYIDITPLEDILNVFSPYRFSASGADKSYSISQTVYNNLMSSVDTFLQKEQGKMNKIVNQLDYYNKLISQLQERLTDFSKQMTDVALNFLRV